MALARVLLRLFLVVVPMLVGASLLIVGPERLWSLRHGLRRRLYDIAPYLAVLLAILLFRAGTKQSMNELSEQIAFRITGNIHEIEGDFILAIQEYASPALTKYFSFMYLNGYTFLLLFPFVAYFCLDRMDRMRELVVACAINYGVGLVFYLLFVAYGPRNLLPLEIDGILYSYYPESQFLTGAVNENTNSFPSLHTSLSMTVFLLAVRTRETYPVWTVVSGVFVASIVVSTMYLGIHWATDVAAGAVLAVVAVAAATRLAHVDLPDRWRRRATGLRQYLEW